MVAERKTRWTAAELLRAEFGDKEDNSPDVAIYELSDPLSGLVFYVGQSETPEERLYAHMHQPSRVNLALRKWVDGLRTVGRQPIMRIAEWVSRAEAADAERRRVTYGIEVGWPLFNKMLMPRPDVVQRDRIFKLGREVSRLQSDVECLEAQLKSPKRRAGWLT